MNKIFATQLNGGHIGQKVRIQIKGTEAVIEDKIKEIRHDRIGTSIVTFVRLLTVSAPTSFSLVPQDGSFRFELNDKLEVAG